MVKWGVIGLAVLASGCVHLRDDTPEGRARAWAIIGGQMQSAGDSLQSQPVTLAPAPAPYVPPASNLGGMYKTDPVPHGCIGNVPTGGHGLNPCPAR